MPTTKTKIQKNSITVRFGYALFALMVLSVVTSTIIPLSQALSYPTARHLNIWLMLLSFSAAAVLPLLVSYLIGDKVTHNKNKLLHHYNGVLFGLASYWLINLFGFFGIIGLPVLDTLSFSHRLVLNTFVPIVLTIAVMACVAIISAKKSKSTRSVLYERSYQIVLFAAFAGSMLVSLSPQILSIETVRVIALLFVVIPLVMLILSYKFLSVFKAPKSVIVAAAIIAVSIAFVVSNIFSQFMLAYTYSMLIPIALGAFAWILYLVLMARNQKSITL